MEHIGCLSGCMGALLIQLYPYTITRLYVLASSQDLHLPDTELDPGLPCPTEYQRSRDASRDGLPWLQRQGEPCRLQVVVGIWVCVAPGRKLSLDRLFGGLQPVREATVPASGTGMGNWSLTREPETGMSLGVKSEAQASPCLSFSCWLVVVGSVCWPVWPPAEDSPDRAVQRLCW